MKHPELSGLLPQFGTTFIKADGGETPQFAPVEFNEKNYGGRTPAIRHRVKNNVKGDGAKPRNLPP